MLAYHTFISPLGDYFHDLFQTWNPSLYDHLQFRLKYKSRIKQQAKDQAQY